MTVSKKQIAKQIFALLFCAAVGATVFYIHWQSAQENSQSAEQTEHLAEQHKIFSEWYSLYQKDIDDLNRNWQLYHHVIDLFKIEDIGLTECHERLSSLADDEKLLLERIEKRNFPPELDDFLYDRSKILRDKIHEYAAAQYRTINLTIAAADPQAVATKTQAEQSRDIQEVMIRESPTGLFIADEVYAVRQYLAPSEGNADE